MVQPIDLFPSDPDRVGRGAGWYSYRYGKKGMYSKRYGKRIHYAKYEAYRDAARHAKTKVKKFNPYYPHIGDGTYRGKGDFAKMANRQRRHPI